MSLQGIIFIDIVGIALIVLIINLIRTKKLHVGFAAIWFLAVILLMTLVSIPPLLNMIPKLVGAQYPASAISLLAFVFIFLMLIFFSVQLSLMSTRQVELIQALAIQELLLSEKKSEIPLPNQESSKNT
jgi:hypothetical protein